jgi:hypothetical protein
MPRKFPLSYSHLSQCYGESCTRQNIAVLVKNHGIEALLNPGDLFKKLLWGRKSPLRETLVDPDNRVAIWMRIQHKLGARP